MKNGGYIIPFIAEIVVQSAWKFVGTGEAFHALVIIPRVKKKVRKKDELTEMKGEKDRQNYK